MLSPNLIKALERDGWVHERTRGATQGFIKSGDVPKERVVIHYHPGKTYQIGFLLSLIKDIGWDENDLKRLKLIKRKWTYPVFTDG